MRVQAFSAPASQHARPSVAAVPAPCPRVAHARQVVSYCSHRSEHIPASEPSQQGWKHQAAAALASAMILSSCGQATAAADSKIGEFAASGFVFKDTVEVRALDDPEVSGVTLYVSDFKRSLVDKLAKDFFSEPSQASLTCTVTGPVAVRDVARISGPEGKEVFAEMKGLNLFQNKTLRVRRIYDSARQALVYIAYSTRLSTAADDGNVSTGRYRTSLCAVSLVQSPSPAAAAQVPQEAAALN